MNRPALVLVGILAIATSLALGGCTERGSGLLAGPADDSEPQSLNRPRLNVGGSSAGGFERPLGPAVPGQIVVRNSDGVDLPTLNATWGTSTILEVEGVGHALLDIPDEQSVHRLATDMLEAGDCMSAHPNWLAEAPETHQGTLPFYEGDHVSQDVEDQDALNRIGAPTAHETASGTGVTVAILDTGIDATHPDLAASVSPVGWDFIDDDADAMDERDGIDQDEDGLIDEGAGHGTHVAGLVRAVAPGASLMAVRVLDSDGIGTSVSVARGIRFAVDNGADVINLSLGMYVRADVIRDAIEQARDAGVVVVTAGGNRGLDDRDHFPSRLSETIAVAATDANDLKADFSNYGPHINVAAPGVGLLSTFLDHGYAVWSGTSMAAPLVSGGAALRLEVHPGNPEDLTDALEESSAEFHHEGQPYNGKLGDGRLALEELVES
jgi:thermitase